MLFKRTLILSILSSLMWMLAPMTLQAQPPAPAQGGEMPKLNEEQEAMMLEVQQTQQALQKTQQALQKIQQKVYADNPSLRAQRDDLQKNIAAAMSDDQYNAEKELQDLNQLVEKYQSGQKEPTQEQIEAFQAKQEAFQERQRAVFQNPEIQQQAEALQKNVRTEIERSGESGQSLIVRLEEQMKKLSTLRQKAMQMMQGQQPQ